MDMFCDSVIDVWENKCKYYCLRCCAPVVHTCEHLCNLSDHEKRECHTYDEISVFYGK